MHLSKMYRQNELIAEIKKKPTLWNSQYKHAADKDLRDMQWIEVAEVLYPDWEILTVTEREEKLFEIKKRWKNIRDYYRKESKKLNGKCYMYKDLLKFLDNPSENTDSDTIVYDEELTDQNSNDSITEVKDIAYMDVPESQCISRSPEMICYEEVEPLRMLKRKREEEDFSMDEDKSFLMSLLPEMRKLKGIQKFDFKISVLNDLRNARYSEQSLGIKKETD